MVSLVADVGIYWPVAPIKPVIMGQALIAHRPPRVDTLVPNVGANRRSRAEGCAGRTITPA